MSFALRFVVARGGPRRGMGGGPVHHAGLNKLERLAGPSVPSSATPQLAFDFAPCILLHAEQLSCAHLSSSSPLASARGSPYTIETGSSALSQLNFGVAGLRFGGFVSIWHD
jgi:hypothetical protein